MKMIADRIVLLISYADIFSYPVTEQYLRSWFFGKKVSEEQIHRACVSLIHRKIIQKKGDYYVLSGRKHIIAPALHRQRVSAEKWNYLSHKLWMIRWIPTIECVGVSGGLAWNNAGKNDDIDLFVITSSHTLWSTRAMITLVLETFGIRRRPNEKLIHNKICLNMFLSSDALALPPDMRSWFVAFEVLQFTPLWQRNNTYHAFLKANRWVQEWFPSQWDERKVLDVRSIQSNSLYLRIFSLCESWIKVVSLRYMKLKRTTERIEEGLVQFHPHDARVWIHDKWIKRLTHLHIPLDKKIFAP